MLSEMVWQGVCLWVEAAELVVFSENRNSANNSNPTAIFVEMATITNRQHTAQTEEAVGPHCTRR